MTLAKVEDLVMASCVLCSDSDLLVEVDRQSEPQTLLCEICWGCCGRHRMLTGV